MKKDKSVKIGLKSLVLMIFSAIFGFSNSLTAYYQMGYATDLETMRPSGKIYKYKGKHLKDNLEGQE